MALVMDGGDGDSGIWTAGFFARGGARCVHRSPLQRSATVGTKACVMHQPRGAERPTQGRPSEVQGPTCGCHPRVERGVLLRGGGSGHPGTSEAWPGRSRGPGLLLGAESPGNLEARLEWAVERGGGKK